MASTKPEDSAPAVENGEEVESPEQVKERAMRQIEFYLSDSNLPYDKFLWTLHDNASSHWIPIQKMAGFNRMRQFQKYGSDWLVEALRSSKTLEVDEKGEHVRRTTPLVQRPRESVETRSVYAKNFPDEYPSLQEELERYFSRFGVINAVRMRRKDDKTFKGSVFCEFSEVESAQRFLDKEEGKPREFKGKELLTMSKADYVKMKCEEKGITPDSGHGGGGGASGPGGKSKFNAFQIMKKEGRTDADPRPEHVESSKMFSILGQDLAIVSKEGGTWKLKDEEELKYVPGAVVAFDLVNGEVKMGAIKATIRSVLNVASYIINKAGEANGYVVLQRGLTDEEFSNLQAAGDKTDGGVYTWKKVSEEEERPLQREHVLQSIERMADDDAPGASKGGRGGGRGGRGRGGRGNRGGGGRGGKGGRDNNRNREREAQKGEVKASEKENGKEGTGGMEVDPNAGVKRKREDAELGAGSGGKSDAGGGPPVIKKARVD